MVSLKYLQLLALLASLLFFLNQHSYGQDKIERKAQRLVEKGQYEKAISKIDQWVQNSTSPSLYHLRGFCYSSLAEQQNAIDNYTSAITIDGTMTQAYFDRAYAYFLLGKSDSALADYNKTIALDLNYAEAFLNRGTVKFEMGDLDGACGDWSTASSLGVEIANEIIATNCF